MSRSTTIPKRISRTTSHCTLTGCVHYVSTPGSSTGGIQKLNAEGKPVPFTASEPYIGGVENSRMIARPPAASPSCEFNGSSETPGAVTVDSAGDIYVVFLACNSVLEFQASGAFVRELEMQAPGVPRVGPEKDVGQPHAVAVDPVSGHLLVTVTGQEFGAVFEFETAGPEAGRFVAQLTEAARGTGLQRPRAVAVDSGVMCTSPTKTGVSLTCGAPARTSRRRRSPRRAPGPKPPLS